MSFYTYILKCFDNSYYTGHTDNLEARLNSHLQALPGVYTSSRLPISLVWSDEFPTRQEALTAERQIKGWSRAKKEALIRSDWEELKRLARSRGSTGSPRTGLATSPADSATTANGRDAATNGLGKYHEPDEAAICPDEHGELT